MAEVRNILFDFGNVIIDIDISGTRERLHALKRQDVSQGAFEQEIKQLIFKFEVAAITPEVFVAGLRRYIQEDVTDQEVIDVWNSMLVGIPAYRLGMLEALKPNFNIFLLSNTNVLHIDWVNHYFGQRYGIQEFEKTYFHEVYYSHLMQKRKPDQEAFRHVIEDALITPKYTLFIDDIEENIRAAKTMGFQVMHSPPEEEVAETLKVQGYY